jgi:hypothetical protein
VSEGGVQLALAAVPSFLFWHVVLFHHFLKEINFRES